MCTHDEQVVEVDQRLREIKSAVVHASDYARGRAYAWRSSSSSRYVPFSKCLAMGVVLTG